MWTSRQFIQWSVGLCAGLAFFSGGCKKKTESNSAPTPETAKPKPQTISKESRDADTQRLLDAAKTIVADPQNWPQMAASLADFIEPANRLGIAEDPEVVGFKNAAHELIKFSSTWISNLTTDQKEKLRRYAGSLEASVNGQSSSSVTGPVPSASVGVGGGAKMSGQVAQTENVQAMLRTIGDKLSPDDGAKFSSLFKSALDAYEKLVQKLRNKQ
jgi:hypothetical protein